MYLSLKHGDKQEIEPRGAFPATQVNHTENIATPTSDAVKADDAVLTLEATLVFNGLKLDIVLPAGQLTSTLAEEVCATAFLTAFGGDKVACVEECRNQISRRRSAQMLYRRWVNKKHLMAFPIPQHMSTAEGVKVSCDDPYKSHPNLTRTECEVIADAEIRNMRYGGKWKTKTPTNADPYSEP